MVNMKPLRTDRKSELQSRKKGGEGVQEYLAKI